MSPGMTHLQGGGLAAGANDLVQGESRGLRRPTRPAAATVREQLPQGLAPVPPAVAQVGGHLRSTGRRAWLQRRLQYVIEWGICKLHVSMLCVPRHDTIIACVTDELMSDEACSMTWAASPWAS